MYNNIMCTIFFHNNAVDIFQSLMHNCRYKK